MVDLIPARKKWHARTVAARERYMIAVNGAVEALRRQSTETSEDVDRAMREEAAACREYSRTLDIFAGIVLDGIDPPKEG